MPLRHVVALAGAHCLGRWWPDSAEAAATAAGPSDGASPLPLMTAPPPGAEGSPRFDNSYFTRLLAGSIPSDAFLLADPETRLLVEEYAASEATFFVDYSTSHDELSRLGMPRGAGGWHRQHRQEQQKGGGGERASNAAAANAPQSASDAARVACTVEAMPPPARAIWAGFWAKAGPASSKAASPRPACLPVPAAPWCATW